MRREIYIGVRGREQWIKAPAPRTPFQAVGWSSEQQQRNGRTSVRNSRVTHMTYELSWPIIDVKTARKIEAMYYGVGGDGLVHWLDPTVKNLAPAHWSMPALGATDGKPIWGDVRPTLAGVSNNSFGLPYRTAIFAAASPAPRNQPHLYIPIPAGYQVHVDVRGNSAAGGFVMEDYIGSTVVPSTAVAIPTQSATSATPYAFKRTPNVGTSGVGIRLAPGQTVGGVAIPSTVGIASLMVEVLPSGQTPTWDGFVIGEGNSGCKMSIPAKAPIAAAFGQTSMSTVLTEVGP